MKDEDKEQEFFLQKYYVGGTLPLTNNTYIKRKADNDLYNALKAGQFCYIFNARQMGKSSLLVRTIKRLEQEGITCVFIDISKMGTKEINQSQWDNSFIFNLAKSLPIQFKTKKWFKDHDHLQTHDKLTELIEEEILKQISTPIVIFIDEIDSVLGLGFPMDYFFAFLRSYYNNRAINSNYQRLTFVFSGVTTPGNLIKDPQTTPFNIGEGIELTGFTFEEAKTGLLSGLSEKFDKPEQILKDILSWTSGQPFLTQKLCYLLTKNADSRQPNVKQFVKEYLIKDWESQDHPQHLRTIRHRILNNPYPPKETLLKLYKRIIEKKEIVADNSPAQTELAISGLVVNKKGRLQVYNKIYRKVFNLRWIYNNLPEQSIPLNKGLAWGTGTALIVFVLRMFGVFQGLELQGYDLFMRMRPDEKIDPRLLVVTIDEEDINYQEKQGMERTGSLADEALSQLLTKLESHQPRTIGLDIYRNFESRNNQRQLDSQMQKPYFFAICKGDNPETKKSDGIKPPPVVKPEQVGFSDVVVDNDGVLRRYLWYATFGTSQFCPTEISFSLQLATHYLQQEGIEPLPTEEGNLQLGEAVLKPFAFNTGGYQNLDTRGYQMLLNYRSKNIAQQVSLRDILEGNFDLSQVRDRIVLIGVTAPSSKDYFYTPYSINRQLDETMYGVFIQAQMVSQTITAALGERPLLKVWTRYGEAIWILGWSLIGGLLVWKSRSLVVLIPVGVSTMIMLTGVCFVLFLHGYWVPWVPSMLGLVATGGVLIYYFRSQN